MSGWWRSLWVLGALAATWGIVGGAFEGDWMASTASMAGVAVLVPFWLRAERGAAARQAPGGEVG